MKTKATSTDGAQLGRTQLLSRLGIEKRLFARQKNEEN
jgi:hypothetical protein